MDQNEFLAQLKDLVEFGKAKESRLSKKEVEDYCEDMQLSKEQLELVFQYLKEHNIDVSGTKVNTEQNEMSKEDSAYLRVYRKEINALPVRTKEELEVMYESLQNGEDGIVDRVIEAHLKKVVNLAVKYKNRGVLLEDLIQEGNLQLIMTVQGMHGDTAIAKPKAYIERVLRARMIELVDEQLENDGLENTIVAKTNLIHEATKVLAKENAKVANIHELAEYTKMTEEEILDIVDLAVDKIEIGACNHHHDE